MNLSKALNILDLNYPFSLAELKKAYYKAALKHHPDRNTNSLDSTKKFQDIQAAYQYLSDIVDDKEHPFTAEDNSYTTILNNFIYCAIGKQSGDLVSIIQKLVSKCSLNFSDKVLENLDKKTLHKLYDYLCNYEDSLHINKDIIHTLREKIKKKISNDSIFTINPSLIDLFQEKVFKLEANNKRFFVPLWHDEIEYESEDSCIIVKCIPDMPKHIYIDHHNDINVNISLTMNNIYKTSYIRCVIADKTIQIPVRKLFIKPLQTYIFKNEGIPKINVSDIYDTSLKSDIVIHISIK